MSLKQEIETWVAALAAYDNNEFDNALKCFETIADTSKILFNCGVIHATLGEHTKAVECYQRSVQLDRFLAVAYFQQGVSNFLMGDFEEALANFNDTLLYLRGNNHIDYEQLGLKFKLYSCEVLFNRGLCYIYLQQKEAGILDLMYAAKEKVVPDHDVIDEAIRESAEGYTVFSIPVGVVYRPNEAKVRNLKLKDYLGKARLVAAHHEQNRMDPRRAAAMAASGIDDRPEANLSYAALNLVKPGLSSRSRQQSEPAVNRQVFPPTPPPELERPGSSHGSTYSRRKSSESAHTVMSGVQASRPAAKPLRLDLGVAAFEKPKSPESTRFGTQRSASERPAVRRQYSSGSARSYDNRQKDSRHSYRDTGADMRVVEDPIEAYSEQTLSPPDRSQHQRSKSSAHSQYDLIEEEDEEDDEYDPATEPLAFEIIPPRGTQPRRTSRSRRAPDLRKLRIKVHGEDMRYVMSTPDVTYQDLSDQIRQKFGLSAGFKLKMKDEDGDLITMSDQDDLDMAIGMSKALAAKEMMDMGKMEIWIQEMF
ncbi:TPR-like protein [Polychaeton citri CBS 116435]|uniref:TPR-like protein n=1 Tax=Polychaeton citri CBS 116435 TaxID=1314669 RepID=A0A9P4QHM4_9PEZI|nr:TPR-like protein [Polychaeton citri CBS 116435]